MRSFIQLFFVICVFVMLSGIVILIPCGLYLLCLPCLFLNLAGYLFILIGILLIVPFVKVLHW